MKTVWVRSAGVVWALVAIIPLQAGCGGDNGGAKAGLPNGEGGPVASEAVGRGNPDIEAQLARSGAPRITEGGRLNARPAARATPTVLFLGTSLTAGYGLSQDQAYPAVVGGIASSAGKPVTVVNAGISGETSAGLLGRIDWAMKTKADIIFIETGANDGLRAFPISAIRSNITKIVQRVKEKQPNAKVVLVPMQMPPNLGFTYVREFKKMYSDIAEEEGVILAPFLLEGVAGSLDLNQTDGIHPNARGAKILAQNMWTALEPLLN